MSADTPSALLSRAADLIRDTAAAARTGESWSAGQPDADAAGGFLGQYGDFGWYVSGPAGTPEFEDSEQGLACARWIALMSPSVAPHLEAILRRAAADIVVYVPAWNSRPRPEGEVDKLTERQFGDALALARAVLGEKEDTDG